MAKPARSLAYYPAPYDEHVIGAMKALAAGNASEGQQRLALRWIVEAACATYDQPYRPGVCGDRDTAFACGRQFVGQQLVKLVNMPLPERRGG